MCHRCSVSLTSRSCVASIYGSAGLVKERGPTNLKSSLETDLFVPARKMYLKNIFGVLLLLLLIGFTVACRMENVDLGSIEGSTYSNSYFGMKLTIPQGWQVQGEEAKRRLS